MPSLQQAGSALTGYPKVRIAGQLIEQAIRAKWFSAVALVQSQQKAKRDLNLMATMKRLDKSCLL